MNDLIGIVTFILENIWYVLPFFILSISLSVLVQWLKLEGMIRQAFTNRIGMAILLATLVGAFSPLCSCTVVPVIGGLLSSGVPLAPIMAFWIASPTMDPEILALSIGILGGPLAVMRLVATLLLSLGAGYLTWMLGKTWLLNEAEPVAVKVEANTSNSCCSSDPVTSNPPILEPVRATVVEPAPSQPYLMSDGSAAAVATFPSLSWPSFDLFRPKPAADSDCSRDSSQDSSCGSSCDSESGPASNNDSCCSTPIDSAPTDSIPTGMIQGGWWQHVKTHWQAIEWGQFGLQAAQESWRWGKWLLLAFLMEALIVRYVPQETVAQTLGSGSWLAIPLSALVGIPLYLTEISALPIVSGLLSQGMLPGAAIAFLIAGPVTTLPAMTAVYGIVNRRIFALYMVVGLGGAILFGLISNWILM